VLAEAQGPAGPAPRVVFVVGLASGGTARHVSALADGCRTAGLDVTVAGPARTLARLSAATDTLAVAIGDRPNPARDIAAIVRLRTWLAGKQADVVHGHGVRAPRRLRLVAGRVRQVADEIPPAHVHDDQGRTQQTLPRTAPE